MQKYKVNMTERQTPSSTTPIKDASNTPLLDFTSLKLKGSENNAKSPWKSISTKSEMKLNA